MPRALFNGVTIAQSEHTVIVDGNHYFPPDSLVREHFEPSEHQTRCGWKGLASYYNVVVNGERNANAAWYYPDPKPAAAEICGHIAFWKGVRVE